MDAATVSSSLIFVADLARSVKFYRRLRRQGDHPCREAALLAASSSSLAGTRMASKSWWPTRARRSSRVRYGCSSVHMMSLAVKRRPHLHAAGGRQR